MVLYEENSRFLIATECAVEGLRLQWFLKYVLRKYAGRKRTLVPWIFTMIYIYIYPRSCANGKMELLCLRIHFDHRVVTSVLQTAYARFYIAPLYYPIKRGLWYLTQRTFLYNAKIFMRFSNLACCSNDSNKCNTQEAYKQLNILN